MDAADFYTGIVADLYGPLKSTTQSADPYAAFVEAAGAPALELGCGDGEPLLELRRRGYDVEGVDSSADMLARCRAHAAAEGLEVTLHHQRMEGLALGRRYRSIYLAGPTFTLLPDDETALRALRAVRSHLDDDGLALIPLFVPSASGDLPGRTREAVTADGTVLRVTALREERDEDARTQVTVLRYERVADGVSTVVDRPWTLHWHTRAGFGALVTAAGLTTREVRAGDDETEFSYVVGPAT
jgi:SAM-dependent methyltransferase